MLNTSPVSPFKIGVASAIASPRQAYDNAKQSAIQTIQDAKNDKTGGKWGELAGQGIFEISMAVVGTKGLEKLTKVEKIGEIANTLNKGTTTIYRTASSAEIESVAKIGLANKPGAYETGKLFAPTIEEAAKFGKNNFKFDGIPNTILEVKVPNNIMKNAHQFEADGMNAISIPTEQLHLLKATPLNYTPLP